MPTWTPPATWTPDPYGGSGWVQVLRGEVYGSWIMIMPPMEPDYENWALITCKRYVENRTDAANWCRVSGVTWNLEPRQTLDTMDFTAQIEWNGSDWLIDGAAPGGIYLDLWCDTR